MLPIRIAFWLKQSRRIKFKQKVGVINKFIIGKINIYTCTQYIEQMVTYIERERDRQIDRQIEGERERPLLFV